MTGVLLSHKLSELAQMALDDLAHEMPVRGIQIDMRAWCRKAPCSVCAAGAVMVARLGLDISKGETFGHEWLVRDFGEHNALALVAIDSLRQGHVGVAAEVLATKLFRPWMDGPDEDDDGVDSHDLSRPMNAEYGPEWREQMVSLIADLREAGL